MTDATNLTNSSSFTFISRCAPYGSGRPQLCLEAALAAAVFEQKVNYVFMGDGVYQLVGGQNAEAIRSKTLSNMLETLELYGIQQVVVDADSLQQRGLTEADLVIPVILFDSEKLANLIADSDCVFNL